MDENICYQPYSEAVLNPSFIHIQPIQPETSAIHTPCLFTVFLVTPTSTKTDPNLITVGLHLKDITDPAAAAIHVAILTTPVGAMLSDKHSP